MKTLLIVYHSMTGGALQMAQAAEAGAATESSIKVRLLHAPEVDADDVLAADGCLVPQWQQGLKWVSFDIFITRIALAKAVTKHKAHVFQHGLRQSLTLALMALEFGYLPLGCYSVFSRNCGGLSTIEPPVT